MVQIDFAGYPPPVRRNPSSANQPLITSVVRLITRSSRHMKESEQSYVQGHSCSTVAGQSGGENIDSKEGGTTDVISRSCLCRHSPGPPDRRILRMDFYNKKRSWLQVMVHSTLRYFKTVPNRVHSVLFSLHTSQPYSGTGMIGSS